MIGIKGIRNKILICSINTKGRQDTRGTHIHSKLRGYRQAYQPDINKEHLFPGRYGKGHIHFRRTALTQMHNPGIPMRHAQSISAGHRTLAALARYLDVTDEQKQRSKSKVRSRLLMAVGISKSE